MTDVITDDDFKNANQSIPMVKASKRNMSDEEKLFLYGDADIVEDAEESNTPPPPAKSLNYVSTQDVPPPPAKPSTSVNEGEVIIIKDQKRRVELSYSHSTVDGKTLTFSIGIPAASVEVQKDGVSILISKDIEIRPPTLTPCILKTSGKEYSVIFAGATHTIGKYINIPFIIVE